MFKGEQEAKLNQILKSGKTTISELKSKKVDPDVPLTEQLFLYRD